jgi:hypothetical protein
MHASLATQTSGHYELRFRSLQAEVDAISVPCDAAGHVDLDALSHRARTDYLFARTLIGRRFANPAVLSSSMH